MSNHNKKKYTSEFKNDAVKLLRSSDKTISELSRDLGIDHSVLSRWNKEYDEKNAFTGNGNPRDRELFELKKKIKELTEERDILKKALVHFLTTIKMKYSYMKQNDNKHSIERMAKVFGVSRSGYYASIKRPESKRSKENTLLLDEIIKKYNESRKTYGSPRIHASLVKEGFKCGIKRVVKLMRQNNLYSKVCKKFKPTTNSNHTNPVADNLVSRNFTVNEANKIWVSDITYIYTQEGWLYLCIILDLYSRKIIGWSMSEKIDTKLVLQAFNMALLNRGKVKEVIFHSDRGIQYTSKAFQKKLTENKFKCSMSRKGDCWDNACAESFFHTLKMEEVYHQVYKSREHARRNIFEYIEVFYNRKRMHSYLGLVSPEEFERENRA